MCVALGGTACSKQEHALYGSSGDQRPYALSYPDSLSGIRTEIAANESQMQTAKQEFSTYPDALSNPNWEDVSALYSRADEAGKTAAYVQELERSETVARFYVDEKDALNRRVGGAATQAAKDKNCNDVELYGPTGYALGKGIEERLRDRLRDRSEAYQFLDDHEDSLGKKNRPKLEEQIDAIARASYLAHVSYPKARKRLAEEVSAASDVKKTLDQAAEEAHAIAADPKTPAPRKAKASEREQKARAAAARVDGEATESKKLSSQMEEREKGIQKEYEDAYEALQKAVKQRASAH